MANHRKGGGSRGRETTITIRATPELTKKLDAAAKAVMRTRSNFIEWVLANYIEGQNQ